MTGVRMERYRCAGGETFDSVALMLYGDEKYAAQLMTINPELVGAHMFAGGEMLRLPDITVTDETAEEEYAGSVAPWRK